MGRVLIELTNTGSKISARMQIAEATTLQSITAELPKLIDSLATAGITIDDFQFEQFNNSQPNGGQTGQRDDSRRQFLAGRETDDSTEQPNQGHRGSSTTVNIVV